MIKKNKYNGGLREVFVNVSKGMHGEYGKEVLSGTHLATENTSEDPKAVYCKILFLLDTTIEAIEDSTFIPFDSEDTGIVGLEFPKGTEICGRFYNVVIASGGVCVLYRDYDGAI